MTLDLEWFCGTDHVFPITVLDRRGAPINLSGVVVSWTVKPYRSAPDDAAVILKLAADGITVIDAAAGQIEIAVSAADTFNVRPRIYVHELKRINSGSKIVLIEGWAAIRRSLHQTA